MSTPQTTKSTRLELSAVGFCGVDASVDPEDLCTLSTRFPWIEWGVLVRPEFPEPTPRYAPEAWLRRLQTAKEKRGSDLCMRLAAHFCGSAARQLLAGDVSLVRRLCRDFGFQRVQVNPTSANGFDSAALRDDAAFRTKTIAGFEAVLDALPGIEFILQVNEETKPLADHFFGDEHETRETKETTPRRSRKSNLAALFDPSCGTGVIGDRPRALPFVHCGYAGGLGPDTVTQELPRIAAARNGSPVWIDMETKIRTVEGKNDIFDLDKVRTVLNALLASDVELGAASQPPQSVAAL